MGFGHYVEDTNNMELNQAIAELRKNEKRKFLEGARRKS
jgi:hypothetical protein